jgi:hypothetical protein
MYQHLIQPPVDPNELAETSANIDHNNQAFYARFSDLFTETKQMMHRAAMPSVKAD